MSKRVADKFRGHAALVEDMKAEIGRLKAELKEARAEIARLKEKLFKWEERRRKEVWG